MCREDRGHPLLLSTIAAQHLIDLPPLELPKYQNSLNMPVCLPADCFPEAEKSAIVGKRETKNSGDTLVQHRGLEETGALRK